MYYAVFLKFGSLLSCVCFWILFFSSCSISECIQILIDAPTPLSFKRINLCLELYMDKSFSLIKLAIIMRQYVFDIRDCNEEVLT